MWGQINGARVQKGQSRILRDGNEVAFGSPMPQPNAAEDYRYIYRHLAARELTGIHAHYDMAHELGKGSFATVMKAMCKENGHWYAVKMIQTKNLKRSMTKQQPNGDRVTVDASMALHKEVQILQKLRHPNICQLKEVFYEENYVRKCCHLASHRMMLTRLVRHRAGMDRWWRPAGIHHQARRSP